MSSCGFAANIKIGFSDSFMVREYLINFLGEGIALCRTINPLGNGQRFELGIYSIKPLRDYDLPLLKIRRLFKGQSMEFIRGQPRRICAIPNWNPIKLSINFLSLKRFTSGYQKIFLPF